MGGRGSASGRVVSGATISVPDRRPGRGNGRPPKRPRTEGIASGTEQPQLFTPQTQNAGGNNE